MRKIALIEDDDDDIYLTTSALNEVYPNIDIRSFNSGEDFFNATDYLEGKTYLNNLPELDLLFIDLNLSGMNGISVLKKVLDKRLFIGVPKIIYTTSTNKSDVYESFDAGASSYIVKPKSYAVIKNIMQSTLTYWFDINTSTYEAV
ncbi:MAG: response regulator [Agarilytica sp.]